MQNEFVCYGRPKYKGTVTLNGELIEEYYVDENYKVVNDIKYINGEVSSYLKKSSYTKKIQGGISFYINETETLHSKSIFMYDELMRLVSTKIYDLATGVVIRSCINSYIQDTNIIAMHQDTVQQETIIAYCNDHLYTYIDMNNERVVATYSDLDEKCIKSYDEKGKVIHTRYKTDNMIFSKGGDGTYVCSINNEQGELLKYLCIIPDNEYNRDYIQIQSYRYDSNNREVYRLNKHLFANGTKEIEEINTIYNDEGFIEKEVWETMKIDNDKNKTFVKEEYLFQWTEI